ncbi:MAG: polysaccharide ABC transporter ATP-binding protein [Beijerinckiaceae bacterium]
MSSDVVIRAEGLGKKYVIGHQAAGERNATFRDMLVRNVRNWGRSARDMMRGQAIVAGDETEEFWALKDVNFEICRGEVVGVIGRNGAGKSTLLKILSRITEPTEGRVTIDGRVASLLEVGTGFHPELSGRENIYLNGAILGMSRAEISRKFDEIVDFAGVEKFLDTPVKRYSSGMYVRLAFAVAAHLEPEILIVDEVLAVGDAEFQKKCLGKMKVVANRGRTVIFVSHSLPSIESLCTNAMLLAEAKLVATGPTVRILNTYRNSAGTKPGRLAWALAEAPGNDDVRLIEMYAHQGDNSTFTTRENLEICVRVLCKSIPEGLNVGFELKGPNGESLFWSHYTDGALEDWPKLSHGENDLTCSLPAGLLNAGRYYAYPKISVHGQYWIVNSDDALLLDLHLGHAVSPYWTAQSNGRRHGLLTPILNWRRK